jgi:hypothetical protein
MPRCWGSLARAALSAAWLGVALASALAAGAARAEEAIERYEAVIEVHADGELAVTETITVRAEGERIQRGIFRDFPLRFTDADGRLRQVSFELVDVTRDGRPEPHFTRRNDRGLRIYAGAEDLRLAPGTYTYRFSYLTGRQLRHLPDNVELYWNVTGNEWQFPIRAARATLHLAGGAAPVRHTAYTGRFGERGSDWRAQPGADGTLVFETTRPLAPGEGLTIVAELPAGAVAAPTRAQALRDALLDHRRTLLGGLGLAGVLVFYLLAWHAVGRDPPKGTVIPLFHPPEGISPALAGYVHRWGWSRDWREFTAAAVSLAVKGLLRFDDAGGGLTLRRQREAAPPGALPPGERALLAWVDGRGGEARIDRDHGKSLASAQAAFRSAIERENRHRFFRRNLGHFAVGAALTALAVWATFAFGHIDEDELAPILMVGVAGFVGGSAVVRALRTLMAGRGMRFIVGAVVHLSGLLIFVGAALSLAIGADAPLGDFGAQLLDRLRLHGFPLALVAGFALLNGVFYYLLRAPTAAGRQVMDRIEGLQMYLRTAETPRLNQAGAPEITAERFERLLPYAIALDAEKPWSEAFERAFARAHPGQDVREAYRPAWRGGARWSGRSFGGAVSGSVAAAQASFASAMPAPSSSSSGFGGGGGSGGGGGGGGGGGW